MNPLSHQRKHFVNWFVYALLQKMNKKKMKGKGKKPSESEEESEPSAKTEQEENESLSEQLNQMAKDLKELEEFEDRQRELNKEIALQEKAQRENQTKKLPKSRKI